MSWFEVTGYQQAYSMLQTSLTKNECKQHGVDVSWVPVSVDNVRLDYKHASGRCASVSKSTHGKRWLTLWRSPVDKFVYFIPAKHLREFIIAFLLHDRLPNEADL